MEIEHWSYKVVNDFRQPLVISHDKICYPPANPNFVDRVDTSFPGILIDFENGYYLLEDGLHRMTKLQKQGKNESLFFVVTRQEYKDGMVDMIYLNLDHTVQRVTLGEWNNDVLDPITHDKIMGLSPNG